jgi:hypothetical protein
MPSQSPKRNQLALCEIDHTHPGLEVVSPTDRKPPVQSTIAEEVARVNTHVPVCCTVKFCPPMTIVPDRAFKTGFAVRDIVTVPFPVPLPDGVSVIQE